MNWMGMVIGAVTGALLGWVMRCPGNTCPILSHWWILPVAGAIFGLTWTAQKKENKEDPT